MSPIEEWEQADSGVRRKVFKPGKELMMMEVRFEKGAQGYEHHHPHEQLTYCLKGTFEFTIDGIPQTIRAGETLNIPGGVKHGAKALEDGALLDIFTPLRDDLLT